MYIRGTIDLVKCYPVEGHHQVTMGGAPIGIVFRTDGRRPWATIIDVGWYRGPRSASFVRRRDAIEYIAFTVYASMARQFVQVRDYPIGCADATPVRYCPHVGPWTVDNQCRRLSCFRRWLRKVEGVPRDA